jgi:hypothetical protein
MRTGDGKEAGASDEDGRRQEVRKRFEMEGQTVVFKIRGTLDSRCMLFV